MMQKLFAVLLLGLSQLAWADTYTYLRCWYGTGTPTKPTTTYVWGTTASGSYYKVWGNWYSSTSWKNMFYANDSQATLTQACKDTFARKGLNKSVALIAAADTSLSFNQTIWTRDVASQPTKINKMVVFGDSLSDNQNMFNASNWTLPNRNSWYLGRFSNERNWVEYLSESLNLPMYNWAVGGAGVTTQQMVIPGVVEQVQSWREYMAYAPNYRPDNTLFTMLIGGNDLVNYGVTVDQIMAGEETALRNIIAAGGRNILVLNMADFSKAPIFKIKSGGATVAAQVVDGNAKLAAMMVRLRNDYPSLNIRLFDTYSLFNDLIANPTKYGVSNTTESCLNINTDSTLNYTATQTARANCTDPNKFVFWDTLHPTTNSHRLLGQHVKSWLSDPANAFPTM